MNSSTILSRENESSSIEKLVAQREIYSLAKCVFYIQAFLSVIILVLLSFAQLILSEIDLKLVIATASIFAVISGNLLDVYIDKLKGKASRIQELFDTYVLNIEWNPILCREKPEHSEIFHYHSKSKETNDLGKFNNWYDAAIIGVSEQTGKIICQKTNCTYDSAIRKKFNIVVLIIGITTILVILLFTIFSGVSISKIILTVIFPAAPIIRWTQRNIIINSESIKNLEQLNNLINRVWDKLKNGQVPSDHIIRQIQDGIFLNRKGSILIPNFIYDRLRDKLEKQTHYSVSELVKEINRQ